MSLGEPLPSSSWSLVRKCDVISEFWSRLYSAVQLTILRERGDSDLSELKYRTLRRHQRLYFLPGLAKLGIDRNLPPAVAAGRYHYLSNVVGGLRMEYVEESARKVWVRYLPPAYSWPGASLFAVPSSIQRRMFEGWHAHNGASLGCLRLGFVVTKVFQDGEIYDEGYFEEFDHDLDLDERVQFMPVSVSPDFDPDGAPKLDPKAWPEERRAKAKRNFSRGYLEDSIAAALSMYGVPTTSAFVAQGCRLAAVQFFEDMLGDLGVEGRSALSFAQCLAGLGELAGDTVSVIEDGPSRYRVQGVVRLFPGGEKFFSVQEALCEFVRVAAAILSPRVRVTRSGLRKGANEREEWLIEDVAERLF